jgi:hypothetical protein
MCPYVDGVKILGSIGLKPTFGQLGGMFPFGEGKCMGIYY